MTRNDGGTETSDEEPFQGDGGEGDRVDSVSKHGMTRKGEGGGGPPHPEIASGRFRSLAMTFQGVGHGMMGKGEASRMIRY